MIEFIKDNYIKIMAFLFLIIATAGGICFFVFIKHKNKVEESISVDELVLEQEEIPTLEEEPVKLLIVDVKGLVNKPGVYQVPEGTIINSVLELAGGLKKGATTKNINLGKKVSDEMVIYVYSEYQLNKLNEKIEVKECNTVNTDISSCAGTSVIVSKNDNSSIPTSNKISINKGTKEQLMTLSGIGEAKADAIIKYREDNNGFKALEEIMNVSGIGEAAYNKIKDSIEL